MSNQRLLNILLQVREQNSQILDYLKKERPSNVTSSNQLNRNISYDLPVRSQEDLDKLELTLKDKENLILLVGI